LTIGQDCRREHEELKLNYKRSKENLEESLLINSCTTVTIGSQTIREGLSKA